MGEAEGQTAMNLVYEALECLGSIHEFEEHPHIFKEAGGRDDGSLRYVVRVKWHLMEGFD